MYASSSHPNCTQPSKTPNVIPVLVPGQEWRTFWDFTPQRDAASDMPRKYSARVAFKDSRGREGFEFTFEIDWQVLIDRGFITIYKMHDAARALRDIGELLGKWNEAGTGMRVIARDGDRKDQRESDYWAQRQADEARNEKG